MISPALLQMLTDCADGERASHGRLCARSHPLWTRERARAEEQTWHADLAVAEVVERTGVPLDTVIDYTPLPLRWEYGGLSFVALQTGKALP